MKKILCFFGTRPEAIKMAPVIEALKREKRFKVFVAVSAQHREMLDQVLKIFNLKSNTDLDLMKSNQTLYELTARVLQKFEPALDRIKPDMVLVHGDTTTTLGGTLASFYKKIPVGHVEAGLRTREIYRPFPEEVNRRLTDAMVTLYFAPTKESRKHLIKENLKKENIFITGNTVIDALLETVQKKKAVQSKHLRLILSQIQKEKNKMILMTAHRRENFGQPFVHAFKAVKNLCRAYPHVHWIYPVHPNPNVRKPAFRMLKKVPNMHLTQPLGYSDLVTLINKCTLVVTDSGGLQEEAPSLGKPVLVLRDVTERPEAVRAGTVRLVGTKQNLIEKEVSKLLSDKNYYKKMANAVNPYGDGHAARRIVEALQWYYGMRSKKPVPFR